MGTVDPPPAEPAKRGAPSIEFDFRGRDCPTCGPAPQRFLGFRGGRHHRFGFGVETRIVECARCGLLFPNPFPHLFDVDHAYGDVEGYFAGVDEQAKVDGFRSCVREGVRRSGKADPSLLDVGSGRGELLRAAQLEGLTDVMGLDASPAMARHAASRGLHVATTTLEELADRAGRTFDILTLSSVLEHVPDPDRFVAAAARLTHAGSVVYLELPCEPHLVASVARWVSRVRGRHVSYNLSPTFAPFHVYGFNPRSLGALLRKHGFAIEDLQVRSQFKISSDGTLRGRLQAEIAAGLDRLANRIGQASNMDGWARRTDTPARP